MTLRKASIQSDLSFSSVEDAMEKLKWQHAFSGDSWVLMVSAKDAFTAGRIAERHPMISVVVVPVEMLSHPDSWLLSRQPMWAVWSEGA